jgi:hypothetical protein
MDLGKAKREAKTNNRRGGHVKWSPSRDGVYSMVPRKRRVRSIRAQVEVVRKRSVGDDAWQDKGNASQMQASSLTTYFRMQSNQIGRAMQGRARARQARQGRRQRFIMGRRL